MMKKINPVFCDECGALALAQIDGHHLCTVCLFKKLESSCQMTIPKFRLKPVQSVDDTTNMAFRSSNSSQPNMMNVILS
ncbi:MAG: hypothetical protein JXR76_26970 [Deltaproteobacteria bacterium]|nr:hypothetical protein [Deltaproteobacteria bacterium]